MNNINFQKSYVTIALICILVSSCKKDDNPIIVNPPPSENEIKIKENVKVIDATAILQSDSVQLSQGIYAFEYQGTPPSISNNSIIVGIQGEGFLRKVTSTNVSGNTLSMNTSSATMEDVFESGSFNFNIDFAESNNKILELNQNNVKDTFENPSHSHHNKSSNEIQKRDKQEIENDLGQKAKLDLPYNKPGLYLVKENVQFYTNGISMDYPFDFNFSDMNILESGPFSITVTHGNVSFRPNFEYDFAFNTSGIQKLKCLFNNAQFNANIDVRYSVTQSIPIISGQKTLLSYWRYFIWVTPAPSLIPIPILTQANLIAKYDADFNSSMIYTIGQTSSNTLSLGINYESGAWHNIFTTNSNNSLILPSQDLNGTIKLNQKLQIVPEIKIKFFAISGPYISPYFEEKFSAEVGSPNLDWQANLSGGTAADIGADVSIFGRTLANYSQHFDGPVKEWIAPTHFEIVAGNNQHGSVNQELPIPLKVTVRDNFNFTVKNVPVYFSITSGGGILSTTQTLSDSNGNAESILTLGALPGENIITASIKKPNGTIFNSNNFSAYAEDSDTSTKIFIGAYNGLFRTRNRGVNWTNVNPALTGISAITVDGNRMFIASLGGLYASNDEGSTGTFIHNDSYTTRSIAVSRGSIMYNNYQRYHLSTDNGVTWITGPHSGILSVGIAGDSNYFAYKVGDAAMSTRYPFLFWYPCGIGWVDRVIFCRVGNGLFAGTSDGVFRFESNCHWTVVNNGLPPTIPGGFPDISAISKFANNIYVGVDYKGLFVSSDNGNSWLPIENNVYFNGLPDFSSLSVNENSIAVGLSFGGYHFSADHGRNWIRLNTTGLSTGFNGPIIIIRNSNE